MWLVIVVLVIGCLGVIVGRRRRPFGVSQAWLAAHVDTEDQP